MNCKGLKGSLFLKSLYWLASASQAEAAWNRIDRNGTLHGSRSAVSFEPSCECEKEALGDIILVVLEYIG